MLEYSLAHCPTSMAASCQDVFLLQICASQGSIYLSPPLLPKPVVPSNLPSMFYLTRNLDPDWHLDGEFNAYRTVEGFDK
jgi:hypothetical protein